ncbi:hypothetical protein J2S00_003189 [Caldalkalibacillus uzonensis]|uniref:Molybdopterin cofactor biosynthesis MoaD-related C-terminal domain-containing protein n=1 Tax=Caldalkalibacillus uzonensis TaxID=353224 RepID=A0ABU0CXE5_9BACI|nr:hypothetical protein [Caldalkalibacillus uzonensis]MDQ0340380.1 hypothetical protein [Caldalkalibacillus uzonensis]
MHHEQAMHTEQLEIRGVNRRDILRYLSELGGQICTESLASTTVFQHPNWECHVSREEFFIFLQSQVPKVHVRFLSSNQHKLEEIVEAFRLKTFRAGG